VIHLECEEADFEKKKKMKQYELMTSIEPGTKLNI
jgi:hypothetical protein